MSLLLLPLFAKPLVSRVPASLTQSLFSPPRSHQAYYWSLPSSHAHLMDIRSMFALCLALCLLYLVYWCHIFYPSDIRLFDPSLNPTPCDSMNCASKPDKCTSGDRRIFFALALTFCLDSIRSIGPGHDHSCSTHTQSVAIFALSHCRTRRYTEMQLTYFSQTGWRKCLSRWTTSYNLQFTDNFIKYLFEGKSWEMLKEWILYGFSSFRYFCNSCSALSNNVFPLSLKWAQ